MVVDNQKKISTFSEPAPHLQSDPITRSTYGQQFDNDGTKNRHREIFARVCAHCGAKVVGTRTNCPHCGGLSEGD